MALNKGSQLAGYEVLGPIGAGGMGEVYRARDQRLGREVAVKVLPDLFRDDPERLRRFEREARVISQLNHPNICTLYHVSDCPDPREGSRCLRFLVLELIEGPTLADRIEQGPVPPGEIIDLALGIVEALRAAHHRDIVHRDLKPANIKLTASGTPKVLDFGLAKESAARPVEQSHIATVASPAMSEVGAVLGTAAYMSPEQACGQVVDKRTDIWAFGCILYEMLTGRRAFKGDTVSEITAAILRDEPDWSALEGRAPSALKRLLRRCLQKDRERRLTDAADLRFDLEDARQSETDPARVLGDAVDAQSGSAWRTLATATAIVAAGAVGMLVWLAPWRSTVLSPLVQLGAELGAPVSLVTAQGPGAILSPDGSLMAFVGQPATTTALPRLYIRRLDALEAKPLEGTEGALNPFFSPDGRWLGFFSGAQLKKIAPEGGTPITLAGAPNGRGGSWGSDEHIVFMPDFHAGLWRVAASGGPAVQITSPVEVSGTHRWPQVLPGARAVLFTSNSELTGYDNADIVAQPLPGGSPKIVQKGAYFGRYLHSGHLTFMRGGALYVAAFDPERLERTSEPVPLLTDVANGAIWTGAAQFSVATNGIAVYATGSNAALPMQWLDRSGAVSSLRPDRAPWTDPAFSHDGRRLAFSVVLDGRQSDIYVSDLENGNLIRSTFNGHTDFRPTWTPDGQRLAFAAVHPGVPFGIYWQRVDGTGGAQRLSQSQNGQLPSSFHPSGRSLALIELSPKTTWDIMLMRLQGDEATGWTAEPAQPLVNSAASEIEPTFSPDGRWLAYMSSESGRNEVYVRSMGADSGTWQVSRGGGMYPSWSRATEELVYGTLDQRLMVVNYEARGNSFQFGTPRSWAPGRFQLLGPVVNRHFQLHPDGRRLALSMVDESTLGISNLVMVFNLTDQILRLLPR